jgi:5-(carboxyamino)imidazole ribonucleotide synthase
MRLGILGGGQLGRMIVQASIDLDLEVAVMDKSRNFPAGSISPVFFEGDFMNYDDVLHFGRTCDIITIEIESINVEALKVLQREGIQVYPQPEVIELIADKGMQKSFYKDHNLPTSNFELLSIDEVKNKIGNGELSLPFVQKIRKGGYDGRGVKIVKVEEDIEDLLLADSVIEDLVDIEKEMAVIVCRGQDGVMTVYNPVEMEFHPTANLVEYLFCPSSLSTADEKLAMKLATDLAEKLNIVGLLAVEMFLTKDGDILINEIAPRPHNSGHHTIEACYTSQYEQLLRVLFSYPQGATTLIMPAVMVNVLGKEGFSGPVKYKGLDQILAKNGVYPHLYGKKLTSPFRKMGHVTILQPTLDAAKKIASFVNETLEVVS